MEELKFKADKAFEKLRKIDADQQRAPIDDAALTEYWLNVPEEAGRPLSLEELRHRALGVVRYASRAQRANDYGGILFAIRALLLTDSFFYEESPLDREKLLSVIVAATAHVTLDLAMHYANSERWDDALMTCSRVHEAITKLESMAEQGAANKLTSFLPGKHLSVVCGLKCRAWLHGVEHIKDRVLTPLQCLAKLQALHLPAKNLKARQIDAVNIAKLCMIYEPDLLASALLFAREGLGMNIPTNIGQWRLIFSNGVLGEEPFSYPLIELELHRALLAGDLSEAELHKMFALRMESLPLFFGPDLDTRALTEAYARDLPLMVEVLAHTDRRRKSV